MVDNVQMELLVFTDVGLQGHTRILTELAVHPRSWFSLLDGNGDHNWVAGSSSKEGRTAPFGFLPVFRHLKASGCSNRTRFSGPPGTVFTSFFVCNTWHALIGPLKGNFMFCFPGACTLHETWILIYSVSKKKCRCLLKMDVAFFRNCCRVIYFSFKRSCRKQILACCIYIYICCHHFPCAFSSLPPQNDCTIFFRKMGKEMLLTGMSLWTTLLPRSCLLSKPQVLILSTYVIRLRKDGIFVIVWYCCIEQL